MKVKITPAMGKQTHVGLDLLTPVSYYHNINTLW